VHDGLRAHDVARQRESLQDGFTGRLRGCEPPESRQGGLEGGRLRSFPKGPRRIAAPGMGVRFRGTRNALSHSPNTGIPKGFVVQSQYRAQDFFPATPYHFEREACGHIQPPQGQEQRRDDRRHPVAPRHLLQPSQRQCLAAVWQSKPGEVRWRLCASCTNRKGVNQLRVEAPWREQEQPGSYPSSTHSRALDRHSRTLFTNLQQLPLVEREENEEKIAGHYL
jgi:hypothetical protein